MLEINPNGDARYGFEIIGKSEKRAISAAKNRMTEDPRITVVHLYANHGGNRRFRGYIDPDGKLRRVQ